MSTVAVESIFFFIHAVTVTVNMKHVPVDQLTGPMRYVWEDELTKKMFGMIDGDNLMRHIWDGL
jgi:hypothetical protein